MAAQGWESLVSESLLAKFLHLSVTNKTLSQLFKALPGGAETAEGGSERSEEYCM